MEKRLVAAILLTVVFLFLYTTLVRPPEERPGEGPVREERAPAPVPFEAAELPAAPPARVFPPDEAKEVVVETDLYRAVISPAGARLKSFRLKNFAERWKPSDEIEREISGLEGRISKNTSEILKLRTRMQSETGRERLERLEEREDAVRDEQEFLQKSLEILECLRQQVRGRRQNISALEEELAATVDPVLREDLKNRIAVENGVELIPPEAVCFNALAPSVKFPSLNVDIDMLIFKADRNYLRVTDDSNAIRFTAGTNNGAEIIKTFTFSNDSYALGLDFAVVNNTGREIREPSMSIAYSPGVGLVESAPARGVVTGIVSFIDGAIHTDRVGAGRSSLAPGAPKLRAGVNVWAAIKGKYFTAALIPEFQNCVVSSAALPTGGKQIEIRHPEISIAQGGSFSADITVYLGPQSEAELSKAERTLANVIDYGFWSPVAKVIAYLLAVFNNIFNNFGIAIIMLSLTVKIVFYPLTRKSFIAMKKMQDDMKAIQPKINELKKKYGNNQQKLNKATMDLYKKEGVNPMSGCKGGCFPMLLQMPVFFALYAVLNTSIDLRGAQFAGWITDLSMPDPLRILPVLMGVSMFWQQKQTGGGAAGPQQEQAKMMQWMMPVMLTFIFFGLPAGIVLYWFSFNIFTSLQQMLIKRHGS